MEKLYSHFLWNAETTFERPLVKHLKRAMTLIVLLLFMGTVSNGQTVTTDKSDYQPGETVIISGTGWMPGETVQLYIEKEPPVTDPFTLFATADADGNILNTEYVVQEIDLGVTFTLTATGLTSGYSAVTYFTDGAPDIEAWHNLTMKWSGGTTVQQTNSLYYEGNALPFQYTQPKGNPAPILYGGETYTLVLRWDYAADPVTNGYFIDYLQSYDATESGVTPFDDFTGGTAVWSDASIPADPGLPGGLQQTGKFYLYNIVSSSLVFGVAAGDAADVGAGEVARYPYVLEAPSGGKTTMRLMIQFTVAGTAGVAQDVGIAFAGHLAEEYFWGIGKGAGNFPGASPQFKINFENATSDENISINPSGSILPRPRIIVVKDANPDNPAEFDFVLQQTAPVTGDPFPFTLVDNGDPSTASYSFLGLEPGTYTVTETPAAGWQLSSITATGIKIQSGSSYTPITSVSLPTITIEVELDEEVTATFLNIPAPCNLIIDADNQTICEGETATLTASATGGSGDYTYEWYEGNVTDFTGLTPVGTGTTYTTPALTADPEYTIRVIDEVILNCEISEPVVVTVINFEPGSIAADQTICEGDDPAPFTSVTPTGDGTFSYQWMSSTNGTDFSDISGATAETYDAGPLSQDTWFKRVVTASLNGQDCTEETNTVVVTVNPTITVTVLDVTICEAGSATLTANASGGNGNYSYLWSTGETTQSILVSPTSTTTYNVTVFDNFVTTNGSTCTSEPAYAMVTVKRCSEINLSKLSYKDEVIVNDYFQFELFLGPDGFGGTSIWSESQVQHGGVFFDGVILSVNETYTLCEKEVPAGWGTTWKVDTDADGLADTYVIPYNPNADEDPPEDLGNRCFDFGAGTSYPLLTTNWSDPLNPNPLVFEVLNHYPGGEPRTPGYWKNWNTCTGGNQQYTAAENGGPAAGWFILDDILNDPGINWGDFQILTCEEGVSILDQRNIQTGKKTASDGAYTLAMHLLAYQLNQAAGAHICPNMVDVETEAVEILVGLGFDGTARDYLSSKDAGYQRALALAGILDAYNNGAECSELDDMIANLDNIQTEEPTEEKPDNPNKPVKDKKVLNLELEGQTLDALEAKVFPNPFRDKTYFEITSEETTNLRIEIFSISGAKVETVYDDMIERNTFYRFEFDGANSPEVMFIYRITTDKETVTGRILKHQ
jgi:hypothetical protein